MNSFSFEQIGDDSEFPDFPPYEMNGGSIVAIAGKKFVVIAADMFLSSAYTDPPKLFKLASRTVLGSTGSWGDTRAITRLLDMHIQIYELTHLRRIPADEVALMLHKIMYNCRFLPYGITNVVAGMEKSGKGAIFSYDPVGNYKREIYCARGGAEPWLQVELESKIGLANLDTFRTKLTKDEAVSAALESFIAASKTIHIGNSIAINVITKNGVEAKQVVLRKS
ncbi:proteasome subunit beta type-1-like [Scaptodrosophila lebanonensis]|uniref:Proteasome subunit beta type-1-like n=1 Tax=Drosophila lebanonensis TaxID=7225 RepID=A0A6J2TSY9_DROLE|nr:proteasome subunit beta type-1-like [Scaptodrosophila lebanonensis]